MGAGALYSRARFALEDLSRVQRRCRSSRIARPPAQYPGRRRSLPIDPIESQYLGQDILTQVITRYPQIAHLIPRDLLWFFAGDCLHYLADEEIDLYQALEERRYEAEQNDEPFDWNQEKQLLAMSAQDSKH
jgi:hypothetical protein